MNEQSPRRLAPAVVHTPFSPVGYVLLDSHVLLPAVWDDPALPTPAVGGLVMVEVPDGRFSPDLLPLSALPPEFTTEPEQAARSQYAAPPDPNPPAEAAPPPQADPEEASVEEEPSQALEES